MSEKTFIKIECPQLPRTIDLLKQLNGSAPEAVARGMRGWAEETRTAAIRVTPKDFGNLRDTIYVKQEGTVTEIGAGGPAAPYAVIVHENLKSSVHWKTPGTGPKYLENPIAERIDKLDPAISAELDKEIAKVGQA